MTWAYLRSALTDGDESWDVARQALAAKASQHAVVARR
jgi:DUF971 family protein